MLLVMFGHTNCPAFLGKYIFSFHVPLFFFLSGYVFSTTKYNKFKNFLHKKANGLLIPYLLFSFINYFCFLILHFLFVHNIGTHGLENPEKYMNLYTPLFGQVFGLYGEKFTIHNEPMWFILCLFLTETAFYFILKFCANYRQISIILLISGILGYLYNAYIKFPLPWSLDIVLTALVFFGIGYILKENYIFQKFSHLMNIRYLMLFFILNLLFTMLNHRVDMYHRENGNFLLFYLAAVAGITMIIILSNLLKKLPVLSFIGINSLIFLSLHEFIVYRGLNFMLRFVFGREHLQGLMLIIENFAYLILATAVLISISHFINKHIPFMIGKKNEKSDGVVL